MHPTQQKQVLKSQLFFFDHLIIINQWAPILKAKRNLWHNRVKWTDKVNNFIMDWSEKLV